MIIAVDETIPYWKEAFVGMGEVRPFPEGKMARRQIADADAIVIRSITRVDAALLEGTPVRFVGTATIGMDHMDEAYLQKKGIYYSNAAGSNANAVAEWLTAALLIMAERKSWDLARKTLAVVGVGQVGSRVVRKARALGMEVLLCDPPLRESTGDLRYMFLEDVLAADILTLHVPLTKTGRYPTWHMFSEDLIARLTPRQFVTSSARGAVIDNRALKRALQQHSIEGAALDVWEGEPQIDYALLQITDIGTPHIAGYSLDGKVCATEMILAELCRFFGVSFRWDTTSLFPPPCRISPAPGSRGLDVVRSVVMQARDILQADARLRALEGLPREAAAVAFEQLRITCPLRPEFRHVVVELREPDTQLAATLEELGFCVAQAPGATGSPQVMPPASR